MCHCYKQCKLHYFSSILEKADGIGPPFFPLKENPKGPHESFAAIPDTWNVEVLLLISLEEARRKVPPGLATLEVASHAQGVTLSASIHDLTWMARFLIGLSCPFIIEQPAELKDALRELAYEMLQAAQPSTMKNPME